MGSLYVYSLPSLELPEPLSDGHAHGLAVLARDSDVHVRGEVSSLQLGSKVLVHVEGVVVDVQFVAMISTVEWRSCSVLRD